jgi:hypothetical protein
MYKERQNRLPSYYKQASVLNPLKACLALPASLFYLTLFKLSNQGHDDQVRLCRRCPRGKRLYFASGRPWHLRGLGCLGPGVHLSWTHTATWLSCTARCPCTATCCSCADTWLPGPIHSAQRHHQPSRTSEATYSVPPNPSTSPWPQPDSWISYW